MPDFALINAGELVTCSGEGAGDHEKLGVIEDGAMVIERGRVKWTGTTRELKRKGFKPKKVVDAEGRLVTPGFVDPHTHLVFAGSREDELERKAGGESYLSILASGGGIQRTIRETRSATVGRLVKESEERVAQLVDNGVTTIEVKTGYGERTQDELKLLKAMRVLARRTGERIVPTFLGLHAKPSEFKKTSEFVDYAVRDMLPAIAESSMRPRFADCFCEDGVFSVDDCERYLRGARSLGFELKMHADEFSDSGGASLSASLGCVSSDHLGKSSGDGIQAMAKRGVVAVLLPGTSLSSSIPYADARGIMEAGCAVALGTDLSPNSWIESPQLVMGLACKGLKMTPAQALLGCTSVAAMALGMRDVGSLRVGSQADFVIHSVPSYKFLPYRLGGKYVQKVFRGGELLRSAVD